MFSVMLSLRCSTYDDPVHATAICNGMLYSSGQQLSQSAPEEAGLRDESDVTQVSTVIGWVEIPHSPHTIAVFDRYCVQM